LAATGGLPGLDAVNEIVIQRGYFQDGADTEVVPPESGARGQGRGVRGQESAVRSQRSGVRDQEDVPSVVINRVAALLPERADHAGSEVRARPLEVLPSDSTLQKAAAAWKADGQRQATRLRKNHGTELASLPQDACDSDSHQILQGGHTIRIPLRLRPGQMPSIRPEDIVLHTGDIVYIEAREAEYFYTGGLLPPGQFTIPRDYDLDVVQAIAMVGGPLLSGGVNPINLAGTTLNSGIGFPSPSLVSVLRRTPDGRQVTIRIDLNQALRDPRERILIQPRDVVLLQERPSEAMARYFTNVVKFTFDWMLIHGPHETGSTNVAVP
jgi:hypothetical protein